MASERRLAVLGSPIAHSKSPALHRAAFRQLGLDWHYSAIEVGVGGLEAFLADLDPRWRGLSLTMPLKHEVRALLDEEDRRAAMTGVVNTLLLADDGRRIGFNTDVPGIALALAEGGVERAERAAVIGGGATAASAVAALAEIGAGVVRLFVRHPERAEATASLGRELGLDVEVFRIADLAAAEAVEVTISTVPGGAELSAEPSEAMRGSVLLDVAYEPWPSRLAVLWEEAGGQVVPGIRMLVHQALLQVRIFVSGDPFTPLPDEPAVLDAMRRAL
ncbi:shikimate dehydrogenase [Agromyces archimandritae]|uniref:Shikimate dehydrogenase n=1 Tax=Agromyces archimandritae TaxID=2781962 RepID=A0A975FLC1_9MICO|nr:shikimate dehydrogenase [Agromyces archimandritae]QTX04605.1 shikimate dehydrogenase [Agromyces archimandritae]